MVCTVHRLQCKTSYFTKHKFPVHAVQNVQTHQKSKLTVTHHFGASRPVVPRGLGGRRLLPLPQCRLHPGNDRLHPQRNGGQTGRSPGLRHIVVTLAAHTGEARLPLVGVMGGGGGRGGEGASVQAPWSAGGGRVAPELHGDGGRGLGGVCAL